MISVEHLTFDYSDKLNVLNDISFTVNEGEHVGVIGPNGAGKTTIFHLLCGILAPKSGSMTISGRAVKPNTFNEDVGYVFQNPDDQLFNVTVFDDVAFGPLNLGLAGSEVLKRVEAAFELTGTTALRDRAPHHLSGGEKRMVAIASVISMNPGVIIFDEPSSNLDMRSRRKLISFLNKARETLLVSSHDLEFILETCRRVILLNEGRVVAQGPCREIMNDEKLMLSNGLERPHSLLHMNRDHSHK